MRKLKSRQSSNCQTSGLLNILKWEKQRAIRLFYFMLKINYDGNFLVEVDVFRLKEKNLCPFARNYYSFPAVKNDSRFTPWPLQNNLIGSNQRVKIELKGAEILPALYSINVNRKFTSIEFDCVKSF